MSKLLNRLAGIAAASVVLTVGPAFAQTTTTPSNNPAVANDPQEPNRPLTSQDRANRPDVNNNDMRNQGAINDANRNINNRDINNRNMNNRNTTNDTVNNRGALNGERAGDAMRTNADGTMRPARRDRN